MAALWSTGDRHGREVSPSARADLLEHGDPLDPQDATIVELPGTPVVAVQLFRDLLDVVTVDDVVEFEVPRTDTVALVEAVLAGSAHVRRAGATRRGPIRTLLFAPITRFLPPAGDVVVVPLPDGARYEQPVPFQPLGSGRWLSLLRSE